MPDTHIPALRLVVSLFVFALQIGSVSVGEPLPAYSREYSAQRDPFADGRDAITLARRTERRILIEVGGDWCTWCHVLERVIQENPELERTLRRHFVVVKVNVSDVNDNADFTNGLPELPGYPKLFISTRDGTIIHSQDPAEFVRGGRYDAGLILDFLHRWAIPTGGS